MQFDFENNKELMVKIEMKIKREKEMEAGKEKPNKSIRNYNREKNMIYRF